MHLRLPALLLFLLSSLIPTILAVKALPDCYDKTDEMSDSIKANEHAFWSMREKVCGKDSTCPSQDRCEESTKTADGKTVKVMWSGLRNQRPFGNCWVCMLRAFLFLFEGREGTTWADMMLGCYGGYHCRVSAERVCERYLAQVQ